MSELMLNVMDGSVELHGRVHASVADTVVAALSADPATIQELEAAMARFAARACSVGPLAHFSPGVCQEPHDAGICYVDLAARLVASCSSWSTPTRSGQIAYHDGETATDVGLSYHLAEDWQLVPNLVGWAACAERRRQDRRASPPWDAREVLYGRIAEYVTDQCLAVAVIGSAEPNPVVDIHARWLLTPRDDLRGQSPREVLLAKQLSIDLDLWDRCAQWSVLGNCPPGLAEEATAYCFGGFGTHETVLYYDLVRFLLEACWERVRRHAEASPSGEVRRLERLQEDWLSMPQPDLHHLSPNEVIHSERRRVPLVVPRDDMLIEDDCPLCLMMAESESLTFWHLDGCNMEDEFAFSFCKTREEWEAERSRESPVDPSEVGRRDEMSMEAILAENASLSERESVWRRSCSFPDALDELPAAAVVPTMLFGLGAHLAELGLDLKASSESSDHVPSLNRDFANLREVVADPESALIGAVVARFRENLASAAGRPDLVEKCADLENQLLQLQERLGGA